MDNYFEHKRDDIVDYLYRLASELKLHVNEGSTSVSNIYSGEVHMSAQGTQYQTERTRL